MGMIRKSSISLLDCLAEQLQINHLDFKYVCGGLYIGYLKICSDVFRDVRGLLAWQG